jgi:sortase A
MNSKWSKRPKIHVSQMLTVGLLVMGISLVTWSLLQIDGQNVSITEVTSSPMIGDDKALVAPISTSPTDTGDVKVYEILYPIMPAVGENIGSLNIPALNQVIPIFHGTNDNELKKGIGHFSRSVLPGEKDNSVLSGHRDTVFRKLGQLKINDQLIVETTAGTFTYEIREIKIVDMNDKTIITPTNHAVLTVTTCYPFDFIGSAPERYILIADLITS